VGTEEQYRYLTVLTVYKVTFKKRKNKRKRAKSKTPLAPL